MNDANMNDLNNAQNQDFASHASFILASKSTIRAQILRQAGFQFRMETAQIEESQLHQSLNHLPNHILAMQLAEAKAHSVSLSHLGEVTLGCDQILEFQGKALHKAENQAQLFEKLQKIQGKSHNLLSAIALYQNGNLLGNAIGLAKLHMRPLNDDEITHYIEAVGATALQSVGGYQLEGVGAQLFSHIEGDYFTILGLPLFKLMNLMRHKGLLS